MEVVGEGVAIEGDGLVWGSRLFFAREDLHVAPELRGVVSMRTGLHRRCPLAPATVGQVGRKLLFDLGKVLVLWVLGLQLIPLCDDAIGLIGEASEMVADEAGRDVVPCCLQEDTPEMGLSSSTGGGRRLSAELEFSLLEVPVPMCPPEIGVPMEGVFGGLGKPISLLDFNWEVVRAEGGEWGPDLVEGEVRACYGEIWGGDGAVVW